MWCSSHDSICISANVFILTTLFNSWPPLWPLLSIPAASLSPAWARLSTSAMRSLRCHGLSQQQHYSRHIGVIYNQIYVISLSRVRIPVRPVFCFQISNQGNHTKMTTWHILFVGHCALRSGVGWYPGGFWILEAVPSVVRYVRL